jgi:hypothetical protein
VDKDQYGVFIGGVILTGGIGSTGRKTCHNLSNVNITWSDYGLNPDLVDVMPANNQLSHEDY